MFSKGMRVTTLAMDNTIHVGKIIGKELVHDFWDWEQGQRPNTWRYQVVFDDMDPRFSFEVYDAHELKLVGEPWLPICECGNMWGLCHPHA